MKGSGAEQFGRFYWCIKVPVPVSGNGEIYVYADEMEIGSDGSLRAIKQIDEGHHYNLVLASGSWLVFYAASLLDGSAVAVEHWEGEIDRGED